ncbi:MAG TPA: threonyl-tRNA synthetase editing domain-containing protein [Methanoregulaceae archaeon]|nr:threonyl-tRNA synthetase editing domain-containing protein [Methanoregulaceae archaeon]
MRILSVHSDLIKYRATKKTPAAEEILVRKDEMQDCVVLFCSVEQMDEKNPDYVVLSATRNIMQRLAWLKVNRVMVFPYAHLTSTLSSPKTALAVLTGLADRLKGNGVEVRRAPFGWYKEFEIKSKGHPLADLSMTICPYEGCECDFNCPYCNNPIRTADLPVCLPGSNGPSGRGKILPGTAGDKQ